MPKTDRCSVVVCAPTGGIAAAYETPYSRFNVSLGRPLSEDGELTFLFSIDPEV